MNKTYSTLQRNKITGGFDVSDIFDDIKLEIYECSEGKRFLDAARSKFIKAIPEEYIRQKMITYLHGYMGVPMENIFTEEDLTHYEVDDIKGRMDIVIKDYKSKVMAVVECKAEKISVYEEQVFEQAKKYALAVGSKYIILVNGIEMRILKYNQKYKDYIDLKNIPTFDELLEGKVSFGIKRESYVRFEKDDYFDIDYLKSLDYFDLIIGEDTPNKIVPFVFNLNDCLLDDGNTIEKLNSKRFELIEDLGVSYRGYGDASGGGFGTGYYRTLLVRDKMKNEDFMIGFHISSTLKSENDPVYGTRDGLTTLIVFENRGSIDRMSVQINLNQCARIVKNKTVSIVHDGKITNKGASKDELIKYVLENSSLRSENKELLLGKVEFGDYIYLNNKDMSKFISNIIEYAVCRNEYKTMLKKGKEKMGKYNWNEVKRSDVEKAIEIFLKEKPDYPSSKNTFLLYKNKKLPAKHIRGMAYKVAFGKEIPKSEFTGGMETVNFFANLGFDMLYKGEKIESNTPIIEVKNTNKIIDNKKADNKNTDSKKEKIKITQKHVIEQKNRLQILLNRIFNGDMVCEKTFKWMRTPKEIKGVYKDIVNGLSNYRGDKTFAKKNVTLRCDFVCDSEKVIIEYDERQHFSEARRISLELYKEMEVGYDINRWIKACEDIQAKDNNPFNRDEIRAYYDSVRDIEAIKNGYSIVRIMHGDIDFMADDAEEKLREVIEHSKIKNIEANDRVCNLKIGMYLQTDKYRNIKSFKSAMKKVKDKEFDILVFPEDAYTPFKSEIEKLSITEQKELDEMYSYCLGLSYDIGKAVIVNHIDRNGFIISIYANANAKEDDTQCWHYIKHTMAPLSIFEFENSLEIDKNQFEPIYINGYKIGMTVCYDCNMPIFSRMHGKQGVDVIINSTGGDVVYDKWYKYNRARAIENNCYNLVTMGGYDRDGYPKAYVYGFNKNGSELTAENIDDFDGIINHPGGIYIYDLAADDNSEEEDNSLYQKENENKNYDLEIPYGYVDKIINKSKKISDKIYVYNHDKKNVVFCIVDGEDIVKPEIAQSLIYDNRLKEYNNKRYIIVNKWNQINEHDFKNRLSTLFKVRVMENFCAMIVESNNINKCYQSGKNRTAQVVKPSGKYYRIDLSRTTGPEAVWRNKYGMKSYWREGYEELLDYIMGLN